MWKVYFIQKRDLFIGPILEGIIIMQNFAIDRNNVYNQCKGIMLALKTLGVFDLMRMETFTT